MILAEGTGGLDPLDHLVVGVFLISMLAFGYRIGRQQKSTDDFFLGGRTLPAWAVGISLFASLLSTITYLGMPGEMFRTGLAFLTRQLPIPLVLCVVWFLWIPFFARLKLTSAYEYLEERFDYRTRVLAAVFCLLLLFGWISVVVLTASKAMVEISNLQFGSADTAMHVTILAIGMFSVVYTTMGGMRAVVWTDVIQFFVLMFGAFFTMGTVAATTGSGLGDWIDVSMQYRHEEVEWFDWNLGNRSTVFSVSLGMFFWFTCTHGANQVALQRYFSVKDMWAARRSYIVSAIASIGIGVILAGVGISMMYYVKTADHSIAAAEHLDSDDIEVRNEAQDGVFPQFIRHHLPAGLRGMVIAALFAAAMSTIDSGANSVSTILTVDFVRPMQRRRLIAAGEDPDRADATLLMADAELKRARFFTAGMGVVVVIYTIMIYHISKGSDIITLCQKGFNCFLGPLGALFVLGMFSKRVTAVAVVPAFLIGEVVGVVSSYSSELLDRSFSTHLVIPCSWLTTIVVAHVIARLARTSTSDEARQWMWRPVVNRPIVD